MFANAFANKYVNVSNYDLEKLQNELKKHLMLKN